MAEAYIYDAVRTPRGKGRKDGSLHEVTPTRLATTVLESLRDRNQLDTSLVDDVVLGCVMPIGEQGANIARTAAIRAGLAETVAGVTVNRFCASGLEATNMAAAQVMSGQATAVIGGGVESMSRVPMGSDGGSWPVDPAVAIPLYFVPQGISADLIATKYGISRDDVDAYAVESQKRAKHAWDKGYFKKSVVPVKDQNGVDLLAQDEFLRPTTTMQSLAALEPSFKMHGEVMPGFDAVALQRYPEVEKIVHVHHAGNSSGIVDGASGILIGSKEFGERSGLKPRARIRSFASIGSEPTIMLTGPAPSTEKALKRAGMSVKDIDLFELNEAFAAVVLRYMQVLGMPHDKINVNGGAIAMGHPLGATGAMILGTLLDELERRGLSTGLATLCVGAGMGTATIIERV
ncbi:MAG: acetyl-CoA C-acetyltransferase [Rhodospirillales bacterium]|nr:MAG: acetyl-CoA C-acetyltransferase [Rhodospirillales bacterium]